MAKPFKIKKLNVLRKGSDDMFEWLMTSKEITSLDSPISLTEYVSFFGFGIS